MGKHRQQAFTLLELAIVLVIIGLIMGGVVLGRSLLANAQLQTVITDADSYVTAVGNFKQQFQALPGDMATATAQWGTDSSGCLGGGGKTGTCNGNGSGMIGDNANGEESFRAWQHLNAAGMFSKRLSGIAASTSPSVLARLDFDIPSGSISGGGFNMVWVGPGGAVAGAIGGSDANYYAGFYGNVLQFGSPYAGYGANGPILTTEQASAIDTKIDDGVPSTGKIRANISASTVTPNCTTAGGAYNVGMSGRLCSVMFIMGY